MTPFDLKLTKVTVDLGQIPQCQMSFLSPNQQGQSTEET